ncbi:MAG: hypothetical protein D3909_00765 [Candidatus Electrothrix sp. ATG1]|nr:hypothetical protein [Candidatus Electrothrix sp. ATG1]
MEKANGEEKNTIFQARTNSAPDVLSNQKGREQSGSGGAKIGDQVTLKLNQGVDEIEVILKQINNDNTWTGQVVCHQITSSSNSTEELNQRTDYMRKNCNIGSTILFPENMIHCITRCPE